MSDRFTRPTSLQTTIDQVAAALPERPEIARIFALAYPNTYETTLRSMPDGTTFVITGDIEAMWLRDSAAQVHAYLPLAAHDTEIAAMIRGVVARQSAYVLHDPYANAFNEAANGRRWDEDLTTMTDWLWERKYEVDSLCAPLVLAYQLWQTTNDTRHFDDTFKQAAWSIIRVWRTEQRHGTDSPYRFQRPGGSPTDTLSHDGMGSPVAYTGMTWSGFRPSDDSCAYGYLVPSNCFAVVALRGLAEIATKIYADTELAEAARTLGAEIETGIQNFATVEHPTFGTIYAYETDGMGNHNLMDDANVPSLLSLPYIGFCAANDPIYQNTRRFILSEQNPYFYHGSVAQGIGSPHTPSRYIWHIALSMQGLTSTDATERADLLDLFERTHAGTYLMHEGFFVDDPAQFTRPWFAWSNSLFSEFVLDYCGIGTR